MSLCSVTLPGFPSRPLCTLGHTQSAHKVQFQIQSTIFLSKDQRLERGSWLPTCFSQVGRLCGVWIKSKCCYLNMGLSYKLNRGCFTSHLAIKSPSRKNVCSETQTVGKSGYPENQLGTTCPGILLSEEGTGELGQGKGPIALTGLPWCSLLSSKGPLGCFWCPPPIPPLHSQPPASISPQGPWGHPKH